MGKGHNPRTSNTQGRGSEPVGAHGTRLQRWVPAPLGLKDKGLPTGDCVVCLSKCSGWRLARHEHMCQLRLLLQLLLLFITSVQKYNSCSVFNQRSFIKVYMKAHIPQLRKYKLEFSFQEPSPVLRNTRRLGQKPSACLGRGQAGGLAAGKSVMCPWFSVN